MIFGIFIVLMLYLHWFNIYHLLVILFLGLLFSYLCKHYDVPVASWMMEKFERPEYRKTFPGRGPIFFMTGSILVVYVFPLKIALASILVLSLGDAISHIFGKLLSKKTYVHLKSLEGTVAGVLVAFLGALIFVNIYAAIFGSSLAMLIENIKMDYFDDNLLVPLVAALVMSLF
jgi:dolichol kinase